MEWVSGAEKEGSLGWWLLFWMRIEEVVVVWCREGREAFVLLHISDERASLLLSID